MREVNLKIAKMPRKFI